MDLSQLQGVDDTLRAVTNITQLIHKAVDEVVPVRTTRRTVAPWWNHSLTLAKQASSVQTDAPIYNPPT